ncbi:alpha/beta hydrolase [Cyanobium sp. FGCU-6]|nr:alpha/beta hydrolase [Cyanobium sp. FGCU6]
MTIRDGVREQLRRERLNLRLAVWLLSGGGLLTALLLSGRLRGWLWTLLSAADLQLLLRWGGAGLLLLIPIAGIVSLVSQYAFWEGWLDGLPEVEDLFGDDAVGAGPGEPARGYVVYLDGIHQSEQDHPPRVQALLGALERRLPAGFRLLRGLDTYTVMPVALVEDSGGSWFWRRVFALQEQHPNGLVRLLTAVLVQANNVIKVGISSDRRYGPIRHYELALKIGLRLAEQGFQPESGSPLVLLGYSGGGEMAFGVADYLSRLARTPLHILTVCGVFSGEHPLERVRTIGTVVGSRDPVAAFGNLAYPGRSPLLPFSRWRLALAAGLVSRHTIDGMNHNGGRGPFSERYRDAVVAGILDLLPPLSDPGAARR